MSGQNGQTISKITEAGMPDDYTPSNHSATVQLPGLAKAKSILEELKEALERCGLVGEWRNAALIYLAVTSRLLDNQVSIGVKGDSSSGKSFTTETVIKFFPPAACLVFTAMSEKALVYSNEEFKHRTLIVYEVTALREGTEDDMTSYFVRSLLSEGRIDYEYTIRGPGGFSTKRITKEGPTNLIFTTTKTRVHAENETRILSLNTDDSPDQTRRVLRQLAAEDEGDNDLFKPWHELQKWLEGQDNRVSIPYAPDLAERIPPVATRLRRDFASVLALIRAHALLHRATRDTDEKKRIVATLHDYAAVRKLVADVLSEGLGATVPEVVRETVETVEELTSLDGSGVMVKTVAERLGIHKGTASRRIRRAKDEGYLRNLEEKRGKPGRWVIGDPLPEEEQILPIVDELSGCTVAGDSEGYKSIPEP